MTTAHPKATKLDSGYWHVRWSNEIWAQWPVGRPPMPEDFFHDTATPKRLRQAEELTHD